VSAMVLYSVATAVMQVIESMHKASRVGIIADDTQGWLDRATYDPLIQLAWSGVAAQVAVDGTVRVAMASSPYCVITSICFIFR
jgi:hypothetical protein